MVSRKSVKQKNKEKNSNILKSFDDHFGFEDQPFLLILLSASVIMILFLTLFITGNFSDNGFGSLSLRKKGQESRAQAPQDFASKFKDIKAVGKDESREETDFYKVTYMVTNNQYIVLLKKGPVAKAKSKAEAYFKDKLGISDLCGAKIGFVPTKEIAKEFTIGDKVPSGCSSK